MIAPLAGELHLGDGRLALCASKGIGKDSELLGAVLGIIRGDPQGDYCLLTSTDGVLQRITFNTSAFST